MDTDNNTYSFFKRYIKGLYTRSELKQNLSEMKNPENHSFVREELDRLWEDTASYAGEISAEEAASNKREAKALLASIRKADSKYLRIRINRAWLRYAAAIILVCGISFGVYKMTGRTVTEPVTYASLEVVKGEHRMVTLPDGSEVLLNACSKLSVPDKFTGDERRVILDGEGYFDIVPDKEKPFIIEMPDATVEVLGTTFNVKAYSEDDQYSVCVESGKVQVELPDGLLRLHPDQQVVFDKVTGDMTKQKESIDKVLSWREGGLYFNRTPLKSVINELYRRYDRPIRLAAGVDGNLRIYGEHENISLESVLESVCYATGLAYKIVGDGIEIYKR